VGGYWVYGRWHGRWVGGSVELSVTVQWKLYTKQLQFGCTIAGSNVVYLQNLSQHTTFNLG